MLILASLNKNEEVVGENNDVLTILSNLASVLVSTNEEKRGPRFEILSLLTNYSYTCRALLIFNGFCFVLGFHMMAILIPCLVQLLLDGSQRTNPSKFASQLHDHCLQRLTKIGPLYPEPFKIVMGQSPELKQKLEAAVRNNQGTARRAAGQQEPKAAAKPKIQLKMDFSNFK